MKEEFNDLSKQEGVTNLENPTESDMKNTLKIINDLASKRFR